MKLIELMVAFVGLPEQYAEIESILVLVGLGLAVVHRIVAGHDGRVGVNSVPGEGTRFVVRLPL